jgi:hypothetical protein
MGYVFNPHNTPHIAPQSFFTIPVDQNLKHKIKRLVARFRAFYPHQTQHLTIPKNPANHKSRRLRNGLQKAFYRPTSIRSVIILLALSFIGNGYPVSRPISCVEPLNTCLRRRRKSRNRRASRRIGGHHKQLILLLSRILFSVDLLFVTAFLPLS